MKHIDYYGNIDNESMDDKLLKYQEISKKIIYEYCEKNSSTQQGGLKLLDAGCGNGRFLNHCTDIPISLYGVDYSENELNYAKKACSNIGLSQADLNEGIPYEDDFFDVVHSSEVIEHLYNPDFFIEEIKRVAKRDALVVITTPNLNSWLSRIMFLFGSIPMFYEVSTIHANSGFGFFKKFKKQDYPVGHIRVMNKDAIKCLFNNQGLEVYKIYGLPFEYFTGFMHWLDSLMSKVVTLSSCLVVIAINTKE